jgi:hypothetical protein
VQAAGDLKPLGGGVSAPDKQPGSGCGGSCVSELLAGAQEAVPGPPAALSAHGGRAGGGGEVFASALNHGI